MVEPYPTQLNHMQHDTNLQSPWSTKQSMFKPTQANKIQSPPLYKTRNRNRNRNRNRQPHPTTINPTSYPPPPSPLQAPPQPHRQCPPIPIPTPQQRADRGRKAHIYPTHVQRLYAQAGTLCHPQIAPANPGLAPRFVACCLLWVSLQAWVWIVVIAIG